MHYIMANVEITILFQMERTCIISTLLHLNIPGYDKSYLKLSIAKRAEAVDIEDAKLQLQLT